MNTHPDTAARAADVIHQERIATARQANLQRQAQQHQATQRQRHRRFTASMRWLIARRLSSAPQAAAPASSVEQAGTAAAG